MSNSLTSSDNYALYIHQLPDRYSTILHSSLVYIPMGIKIGKVKGMVVFSDNVILCVQEFLNFELQVIEGYGYEVSRSHVATDNLPSVEEYCRASYAHKDKLWWYDSFPHPNDISLASTHPHHKHIPPDIKHNRIAAQNLTFTAPNLTFIIEETIKFIELELRNAKLQTEIIEK